MEAVSDTGKTKEFVGEILADKYHTGSILRKDDFGTVYNGVHLLMEKPVIIKILSPDLAIDENIVEGFSFEAKTISRLSHPNILNITDFGRDKDGTVFLVMEHAAGETIKDLILREGALPVERAVRIARQIAAALSAAHSNRIFHTTLSSNKVMVAPAGNGHDLVKVFDIGSFTTTDYFKDRSELSIEDVSYLSPEQCSGESEPDERSDIYSLGIIFYELLTGELPFTADTEMDLMLKHAEVPPPPLVAFRSDVPEEIEPILLNALAKDPDHRYQSAEAFAEDLADVFKAGDDDETIVIPHVSPAAKEKVNVWKTAFIALAGMSVLALALIYFTGARRTDTITALPTDENSLPVQPLNPATGVPEQGSLTSQFPGALVEGDPNLLSPDVGGDGYDPWGSVSVPPPGGSQSNVPIGPGEDYVTIPNDGSIFMPNPDGSGGIILVPKIMPADTPTPETKVSPKPDRSPDAAAPVVTPGKLDKTATPPPVLKPKPTGNEKSGEDKKSPTPSTGSQKINDGFEQVA